MEDLVKKWYDAKVAVANLEKDIDKYKIEAQSFMKQNKEWRGKDFVVEIKKVTRRTTSRDDFPDDKLWKAYSHENTYDCYYVYKAGEKKRRSRSRSPPTR